jgi:RES domain-containing protein
VRLKSTASLADSNTACLPRVLTAWRIVKRRYAANAFEGDGARLFGGRWNSPGVPMVYVASTRALAALEQLVHLDRATLLSSFVLIPCEFDEQLVTDLDLALLPDEWRREPPPSELAVMGDQWIKNAVSAVLSVPSAVIGEEKNFLLNPAHSDSLTIKTGDLVDFEFDRRLIK